MTFLCSKFLMSFHPSSGCYTICRPVLRMCSRKRRPLIVLRASTRVYFRLVLTLKDLNPINHSPVSFRLYRFNFLYGTRVGCFTGRLRSLHLSTPPGPILR